MPGARSDVPGYLSAPRTALRINEDALSTVSFSWALCALGWMFNCRSFVCPDGCALHEQPRSGERN
jgi:hypothetical protein